jgi:hypothetical protein
MIYPTKSKYMHAWIAPEEVVGVGDCLLLLPLPLLEDGRCLDDEGG